MECVMCSQVKTSDDIIVFSYGAYAQILSILKRVDGETTDKIAGQNDLPIHVCRECLQGFYQHKQ